MDRRKYECPDNFIRLGNSCYYLSADMDTWHGAQFMCKDMSGSQLATPDKKWKDRKLKLLLNKKEAGNTFSTHSPIHTCATTVFQYTYPK